MAGWPETPRLIGTSITRLDGLPKATGKAKYPSDVRPDGLLYGVMVYSPHAHAKVKSIDIAPAQGMPGVKAVISIAKEGTELRYEGDDVAAVAAETEEQARDAARAIKVEYEVLPHVVTEDQSLDSNSPEVFKPNARRGATNKKGDPDADLAKSDATIDASYTAPVITHVCLEPHGLTAKWDDGKVVAWASTQNVNGVANDLANTMKVKKSDVTVYTDYMGGGFGSKFSADIWGNTAAQLSKQAGGRPVWMFLDRRQEHLAAGNRPSGTAHVRMGATKDGKLTAVIAETHGTGGTGGGSQFPFPYVYNVPASSRTHTDVFVNCGRSRAMRAPGHPQGCIMMESAMDDLAAKLEMDPLEFRLKNLLENDPVSGRADTYRAQIKRAAELIGWKENWKPRGQNGKGPIKRGLGMGLHQWGGGGAADKKVSCTINPDGSIEVRSATQDIGTGTRTILAIITAEVFGLQVSDITSNIGNSNFPPGQASGGSTTCPSMSPPCYNAALQARDQFAKKLATALNCDAEEISFKDGKVFVTNAPALSWKDACKKLGMMSISVEAGVPQGERLSSAGVGGCQMVDLEVDIETGVVKLRKIVAIQDSGLIIDMLTWKSQVSGGVIGGLNYGLFEERIMDPTTGIMLNADMEMYKLAGASDIPEIIVEAYDPPEMRKRGVIGVGEPPTISTAAAIGNAVANAIGVRVPVFPMSPMNILNALATASKANGRQSS